MKQQFNLRSTVVFFAFLALYFVIAVHLYTIQIKHHSFYVQRAQQQYQSTTTQYHSRGTIVDRTGNNYFALNRHHLSAFIFPLRMNHKKETIAFLQQHFPDAHQKFEAQKHKHFMFIKRRLSPEEHALIIADKNHDICLLSEPGRYYPIHCAAPVIGVTSTDNKGLFGIELMYNDELTGIPTISCLEKDARSGHYHFKKETTTVGDEGNQIQLSLDAHLQFLVGEKLQEKVECFNALQASALIMDPKSGEILVMASYPFLNPHDSTTHTPELCNCPLITDAYELGSVIKVFAALAALEEQVVTLDELIDCHNTKTTLFDGRTINTVKAHGIIPFADVIAFSNNIGIAQITKRIGPRLYDHYVRLGFGRKTGVSFLGENSGFINPPKKWSKQSLISLSYGYEISVTLLQLACAFSLIATGNKVTPTLLKTTTESVNQQPVYSTETLNAVKNILEKTTAYGTARSAAIKGYRIMSKTGTANRLINGSYDSSKHLYTCAGIVEKDDYQRVIVVFIKQTEQTNLYASTVAAPLFEQVAELMLIHDKKI